MDIITRKQAKERGLRHYFTGKPCPHGHVVKRFFSSGRCADCALEQTRNIRLAHPEKKVEWSAQARKWREANAEKVAVYNRDWHEAHREKAAARNKLWHSLNRDRKLENNRRWNAANPDKVIAYSRKNWKAHREERSVTHRAWQIANPDKVNSDKRNRIAKRRNGGSHTAKDIAEILAAQGGKCAYYSYCGTVITSKNKHVDHIIPVSAGGSNRRHNLQILCRACNCSKHAKDPITYCQSIGFLL